jgi:hypothetical protein
LLLFGLKEAAWEELSLLSLLQEGADLSILLVDLPLMSACVDGQVFSFSQRS